MQILTADRFSRLIPENTMTTRKNRPDTKAASSPAPTGRSTSGGSPRGTPGSFPIVGIGASAGGLAAFEAFFSGMPSDRDPDMAFVLVQHLAPDHKSILTEIIQRYTRMQVYEVADGVAVRPNCVYIIPPNRDMAVINGTLQLLNPVAPRGQRMPIDYFLHTLSQDQHERAIAIILSGTGSDGTLGVRAVKGEGGMVMAQKPESCEYDGMPRSAIATGTVDFILPPAEMPAQIIAYVSQLFGKPALSSIAASRGGEDTFRKIFILLRSQTGHDFSLYKHNTVARRIERRMAVQQVAELADYVSCLQQSPAEVEALFYDLLIGVTSFFRDRDVFSALATDVIPRLFAGKKDDSPIRIWTTACSTGEEAYSIAILLQEQMDISRQNFKIQLFATDIDDRAIDHARRGMYPASIASDVSPERLNRFFVREPDGGGYRVTKGIRDMLIFSKHDITKDPPFSRLDLISCRNLLIYMGSELQKRLIPLFHYALNPHGILFLGTSESVGDFMDLFVPLDRQSKLYLRKNDSDRTRRLVTAGFQPPSVRHTPPPVRSGTASGGARPTPRELTERFLLQKYAPVSALVNERGDIIYLHGRSGQYLELAPGEADINNILKTAREGLRHDLATALHRAVAHKEPVHRPGVRVKTNGHFTAVNLKVEPLAQNTGLFPGAGSDSPLFLIILEEAVLAEHHQRYQDEAKAGTAVTGERTSDLEAVIASLRQELQSKEEYLQSTNEELENSVEELRSSNEEMQSVNEELQSTNEELETSKEELQSLNEELATVNSELNTKIADLSQANNDMNNLLAGTGLGTIFVDLGMHIQRFTPAVTTVINLIKSDVGRPLGHIVTNLVGYDNLVNDVQEVLDTLVPKSIEVEIRGGEQFMLRIRPYRTMENVIEGAVITFVDITEMVRARETQQRLGVVLNDARDAITVLGLDGRILAWNAAAERIFGWSEAEALAMNNRLRIPEGLREEAQARMQQLSQAEFIKPYHTQLLTKDGRTVEVWLTATPLVNSSGQVYAIATTERVSVTDWRPPAG
jgi:two-component system CheB/CheR fusion protein